MFCVGALRMEVVVVATNHLVWTDPLNMGLWLVSGEEGREGGACYLLYEPSDSEHRGLRFSSDYSTAKATWPQIGHVSGAASSAVA